MFDTNTARSYIMIGCCYQEVPRTNFKLLSGWSVTVCSVLHCTQASVAFDGLPKMCPIASPPLVQLVAHRFCRFLGRQLEVASFETCVATSSQLIAYPVAHRFTTLAVYSTLNGLVTSLRLSRDEIEVPLAKLLMYIVFSLF